MPLVRHGYRYSVYNRIACLALAEKGVACDRVEVDPFAADMPAGYLGLHPFGRVPALVHDGLALNETAAITRYLDRAFDGPSLQPRNAKELARMDQIIAVVEPMATGRWSGRSSPPTCSGHGWAWPSRRAKLPAASQAAKVLAALEALAGGGPLLVGDRLSLADLHLGAMIAYFTASEEGRSEVARHPKLAAWWQSMQQRSCLAATEPGLPW